LEGSCLTISPNGKIDKPGDSGAGSLIPGVRRNRMVSPAFQSTFNVWLDGALREPVSPDVIAFSFNLAEPWCIEMVGSDRFSEEDSDWACEETFRPEVENLDLPESEVGSNWEEVLAAAKGIVLAYMDRPSAGSELLKKAVAVSVGFVDGELHRVWPR
jgi:hypothetical protein